MLELYMHTYRGYKCASNAFFKSELLIVVGRILTPTNRCMPHPGLHSQTIRSLEETEQSLRTSKNPELSWTFAYKTQTTA